MTTLEPAQDTAAAAVESWNTLHPVGTPVRYWPGFRVGEGIASKTRTRASVLSGHTAVVWVEGHPACIALTHIELDKETGRDGGAS